MPAMRVAMFSDYYPPHLGGGVEKVVFELSRGLSSAGANVDVFTLQTAGGPCLEEAGGVRVHRVPALQMTKLLGLQSAASPRLVTYAVDQLMRLRPDVIHVHNRFFFTSLIAAAAAKALNIPLITTLHLGSLEALPLPQRLPVLAYERLLGRTIIQASERVIAVSQAVADYTRRLGATPEKTQVQPNAVDSDAFRPRLTARKGPPRIAFVGRLIQNKGPQYLMAAIPRLVEREPAAEFWFVGDGPMRACLEETAQNLGVAENVRFLGVRQDVAGLLNESDIFVRPSLMEGMPLTVLEAMACGLPVVATPVGGTAELVTEGKTGLLVPPRNVDALTTALQRLIDSPQLRAELGANGRRLVEKDYGWQRISRETLAVYEDVLQARGRARVLRPQAA
jgi:glycosyltransferase involved in cell wall biosynthesis